MILTIQTLRKILRNNGIKETACLIEPISFIEGALCLKRNNIGEWQVVLNERGTYLINKTFQHDNDAFQYFLIKALSDPTNRIDFKPSDLLTFERRKKEILEKYGFKKTGEK